MKKLMIPMGCLAPVVAECNGSDVVRDMLLPRLMKGELMS